MSGQDGLKGLLAFSGSVLAIATATPALAQDANYEIIVTAQKRDQDIQDVPLAVTALSANQLDNAGVVDIRALQTLSPSINLNSTQTESGGTTMRIRGVGTTGNNAGLESAVGVFIDGVYVSRPAIALGELLDIQQVEILRGPQGTLFGRNTSAGAVTITTRSPDLHDFGAFGNMTVGEIDGGDVGGLASAQFGVNIPIVTDQLAVRIAAAGRVRDGLLTSTFDGEDQNTRNRYIARAQALWEPTDNLRLRFIADHQEGADECCDAVLLRETAFIAAYPFAGLPANGGAPATGWSALENRLSNSEGFRDPGEQTGYSLQADWDLGFGTMTYVGGHRESEAGPNVQNPDFVGIDVFSVPGGGGPNTNFGGTEYTSHEIRLSGETDRLNWMVGYYNSTEEIDTRGRLTLGSQFRANTNANIIALLSSPSLPPISNTATPCVGDQLALLSGFFGGGAAGCGRAGAFLLNMSGYLSGSAAADPNGAYADNRFTQEGDSESFFTHNTFAVTDRLDLTLGARYVEETKDGAFSQISTSNTACLGAYGVAAGAPVTVSASLLDPGASVALTSAALASATAVPAYNAVLGLATQVNLAYTCFPFAAPADVPGTLLPRTFDQTFEDSELVYTGSLAYAFTDDIHGYASVTHGFKSGGFNLDPTAAADPDGPEELPPADPRFRSEVVDSYELGLKTELLDGRIRANFAAFRSEMEDFQVLEFTGVQFTTFNVPRVLAQGAEIELQGRVTEDLGMSFAVTYTDAGYPSDCAPADAPRPVASLCGSPLTNAPEWVGVLGMDYGRNLGNTLRWFVSGSARYESERRTSTQAYVVPSTGPLRTILNPDDIQEANTKVNLRLGIGGQDERWALEFWGTNIFNEQTRNVTFNIPLRGVAQYSARGAFLEEPAIYGVTLRSTY